MCGRGIRLQRSRSEAQLPGNRMRQLPEYCQSCRIPFTLQSPARPSRGLLFRLCLGLVSCCLLIGQILGRVRIRRRRRHIGSCRGRIRSFWQPSRALLFCQSLHAVVELFLEMVVHLLQIFHGNCDLLARAAVRSLAGRDTRGNVLIGIWSIGEPRDDVPSRELAFLAIGYHRDAVVHDKSAPRGIQCRRNLAVGGSRSLCLSARRLLLIGRELRLHFFCDGLLHFWSQRHRSGVCCLSSSVPVV